MQSTSSFFFFFFFFSESAIKLQEDIILVQTRMERKSTLEILQMEVLT
jgi:hypothetical protein